jgi:hypothetical protein
MSALRPIAAVSFPDVVPGGADMARPVYIDADPASLLVDEAYQRGLSRRSRDLIRRILAHWDWRAFKPPVVVDVGGVLHVIDGQHTAIAAASHPAIDRIPVQLVEAAESGLRADAFVRHNRDRVTITPVQIHHAMVAAGNEEAQTIAQVCARAGVTILRQQPSQTYQVGETMSVSAIARLVDKRFAAGARRVLAVCVDAKLAPVSTSAIKAVESLLFDAEYAGEIDPVDIATTFRRMGPEVTGVAKMFAAGHKLPLWRSLATVIWQNTGAGHGR